MTRPTAIHILKQNEKPVGSNRLARAIQRLQPIRISGQGGFIRGALHNAYDCIECHADQLHSTLAAHPNTELVFWNLRCFGKEPYFGERWSQLAQGLKIPQVLVITNASARKMAEDELLDRFVAIIKREPYRDRERYPISAANADKIFATMLSCNPLPLSSRNVRSINPADHGNREVSRDYRQDVFFSGEATNTDRIDYVTRLRDSEWLDFAGGLQPGRFEVDASISFPRMKKQAFARQIEQSRINLALPGYGEFTFRHLELSYYAAFCLSTDDIRELELPIPYRAGEHYAAFTGIDELIEKIRHYLANEDERIRIARNGRHLFEQHYDLKRHGAAIAAHIDRQLRG